MRIAYDFQAFALQSYGGISRYFTRLAQGLLDFEHQVEVFAPLHRNKYLSVLPKGVENGRFIEQFPPKTSRLIITYNQFRCRYKIAKWNPDVVHETYYNRIGMAPKNCPTVITVYDLIHEMFPHEFSAHDSTREHKKHAIDRADHVICISENTKKDLMRLHGTSGDKISVVHLGFDQFVEGKKILPTRFSTAPFLLYVGQRGGYKNFTGFLKAVSISKKLLSDFEIIAFGGGRFSAAESMLIQSFGFATNQVQQVSGNDDLLGQYYQSARAFVYPSLYEGFGIPPLEAMTHLCPVISSKTSSMPEVIGVAAEYFDPTEIEDMRRAIENVVYSDNRLDELRKEGFARLSHFSWKKCSEETLAVYRLLTGEK
jgi:glycosyltransferase involved in cell wall biosynthesis